MVTPAFCAFDCAFIILIVYFDCLLFLILCLFFLLEQFILDDLDNPFDVGFYFLVTKTNNMKSFSFQVVGAYVVLVLLFRRMMVSSIHFNDESCRKANEVCDVLSYGVLTSEPITLNVFAKGIPKHFLTFSHLQPVVFSIFLQQVINFMRCRLIPFFHHGHIISSKRFIPH